MEWKKVKTLLICVLASANIFLAGNIFMQMEQNRSQQRAAFDAALGMLSETVGEFDENVFRDVKKRASTIYIKRDDAMETKLAKELISSENSGTVGGGIHFFTSATGKATFRNGGMLNISWQEEISEPIDEWFKKKLARAGLDMSNAETVLDKNGVYFHQKRDGKNIENATIFCTYNNGNCEAGGKWAQGKVMEEVACKTGYEMVLALNNYFVENDIKTMADKIEIVYFVDGKDDSEIVLTAAWKISTGDEVIYLSCETGEEKVFEATSAA